MSDTKEFEPAVSYDDNGRVTQKQTYDRDGNPDRTYKYSYTGNGETVEQSFDSKTGELGHEEVFDKNGNTLKEIFRRDGQIRSAYTHQYNDDGSLAETVAYENDNGSLRVKSQFFVEKDNVGREVYTSRSFDESGKPVQIERGYNGKGKEGVFLSLSEGEKGFGARHDEFFKGKESWKSEDYLTKYAEIKPVRAEEANKNASEKVMGQDGSYHVVERSADGVVLSDESFDRDGNMKAGSYYKNGVLDSKTIYNEDGSQHSFFYEDDGSVRSEKFRSADGRSVSSIAHTSGMTMTVLLDEQGRTTYSASYYNDGGKLYPWNEHSYAYDADGKKIDGQARSFGTDGEKGGKTSEELLSSLQYKDEWLMQTFADRVSGRVTAEEAQKTSDARPQSKDERMTDAQGFEHSVSYDDAGRVVADKKYDKDGKLVGEGIYKDGEPMGHKEYFTDDKGLKHTAVFDAENRVLSDQAFDKDGNLRGEGIYENGKPMGRKEYFTDDKGLNHTAVFDAENRVLSDQAFDKDGNLRGEGIYKDGEPMGRKMYRTDDKGLKHTVVFDLESRVLSDQSFDKDGNLRGEGIYENGEFKGSKAYFEDDKGFSHVAVKDEQNRPVSDQKFDKDGKLVGEGIYINGQFRGSKEYLKDDKGFDHVVTRNASNRIISEQKFDKDGRPVEQDKAKPAEKETVQNDVKTPAPEKKPAARTTTLPSVRGNAMPERAKAAETVKENAAQATTLPSVHGNAMPERAKTADYENAVADSFVNLSKQNSQGNVQALFNDMQNLMQDYRSQGLTAKDIQQKMQAVLSAAYDKGIAQGLGADLLKNNIARFSEGFNKEAERETAEQSAAAMPSAARDGKPDFSDAEYVDYEEVPDAGNTAATEENAASARADEGHAAEVEGDEVHIDNVRADEGHAAEVEGGAASMNDVKDNDGKDNDGNGVVPPAGNGNDGKASESADGAFWAGEKDADVHENGSNTDVNGNNGNANSGDLLSQMMDTSFKNRYMMVEDGCNDPSHLCPFGQLKSNTVEDHSDDKDDPRVSMLLDTGATLVNRPNRVHVQYTTKVTYDDNGNEVRSPQVSLKDCMAAVRLGMEKGWTSATLNGPDAYKEQMYLAMRAMGMKVVGYQPSAELQKKGDELAEQHLADRRHADLTDKRYPAIQKLCKDNDVSKPEQIGEEFVNKMDKDKRYDPASEELALTEDGNYTVTTYQNKGEENESKSTVTYGFGGKVLSKTNAQNNRSANTSDGNDNAGKDTHAADANDNADKGTHATDGNDNADKGTHAADANDNAGKSVEQPQPVGENAKEKTQFRPAPEQKAEATTLPAVIGKDGKANEAPEQVPPVKGAENNLPVPVTPRVKTQLALEAAGATTALAKTDPVKAQQMATQVATTKGIANQLQVVGQIANQAKGNDTQLALTQHRQKETAIILASQKDKTK